MEISQRQDEWQRIGAVFDRALALSPADRQKYLDEACGDQPDLRREVDTLLKAATDSRLHPLDRAVPDGDPDSRPNVSATRDATTGRTLSRGVRLGSYEILTPLGAGGMGQVYAARDTRLDRVVALKILSQTLASDPNFRLRFQREARLISRLDHPHICALYDVGEQDGTPFLVMQYLDGETLEQRLRRRALPLTTALKTAIEVADGLVAAHRLGIVHRDLKPGNIFLTKTGAKLLDFGLAKHTPVVTTTETSATEPNLTSEGTMLGTAPYMAEQLEGRAADVRTDIFAFGSVFYEMVTGRRAFTGTTSASLLAAILTVDPPSAAERPPHLPRVLDRVVMTCLAKDPNDRFQTTHDLLLQLRWLADVREDAISSAIDLATPTTSRRRRDPC